MSKRIPLLVAGLGTAVLGAACLSCAGLLVGPTWFAPGPVEDVDVQCAPQTPPLPRGRVLRALVWNIQFSGSRNHHFFYDDGDAVSVPPEDVERSLNRIAQAVTRLDPDLILWQEVDRASRRTGYVDQQEALLQRNPYPCHLSTPYHRAPYVPHPPFEHLGAVDMHLAIWSKYQIREATRIDLPRINESFLRQQFNLKRALLSAKMPIEGGGVFHALNTHLSAFSMKDGTLKRQLDTIRGHLDQIPKGTEPWLLGGDMNCLPPGDDPQRLSFGSDRYEVPSPLETWFEDFHSVVPLEEYQDDPEPWRTFLPFGASTPDRTLDYAFHGEGVRVHRVSVVSDLSDLSDHVPLLVDFELE